MFEPERTAGEGRSWGFGSQRVRTYPRVCGLSFETQYKRPTDARNGVALQVQVKQKL